MFGVPLFPSYWSLCVYVCIGMHGTWCGGGGGFMVFCSCVNVNQRGADVDLFTPGTFECTVVSNADV